MNELNDSKRPIFVSGAAGFIGAALCLKLLENGENVIGFDNLNNYYDVNLKKSRLKNIFEFFSGLLVPPIAGSITENQK